MKQTTWVNFDNILMQLYNNFILQKNYKHEI